ncbi:hypothetical protein SB85_02345 [Xanthomonas sacchari]|nr:hypothetical protein SB85_02345 [Xanthomonas sacchari]
MRNRKLTGPWAGFSFEAGMLVTPEGRRIDAWTLRHWSLTCTIADEWRRMMDECRQRERGKPLYRKGSVAYMRDRLREDLEKKRSTGGGTPGPETATADQARGARKRRGRG